MMKPQPVRQPIARRRSLSQILAIVSQPVRDQ